MLIPSWLLCHDGNTGSGTIIEFKHLELDQFSVGYYLLGSGECCSRAINV